MLPICTENLSWRLNVYFFPKITNIKHEYCKMNNAYYYEMDMHVQLKLTSLLGWHPWEINIILNRHACSSWWCVNGAEKFICIIVLSRNCCFCEKQCPHDLSCRVFWCLPRHINYISHIKYIVVWYIYVVAMSPYCKPPYTRTQLVVLFVAPLNCPVGEIYGTWHML